MLNVLPFEIISRKNKSLLITYLSSVDVAHEGMKRILKPSVNRGIISESYLLNLLASENIEEEKGKDFLVTTGVVNQTKNSALWESALIVSDAAHVFDGVKEQWIADGINIHDVRESDQLEFELPANTLLWMHFENYQPEIIKSLYSKFEKKTGAGFIQSYYLKESFRIDGVYSPVLGTPCHFCHIERWLNREEKSFRRNEMSWANLLQLLRSHQIALPALALSNSERGFSQHLIKRRLQELIGIPLITSHVDTFMSSVSTDLITCVLNKEPVIHWQACGCVER
ncbi:McbB family protein [Pantoea sp. paga]|uniref:McbB family protein n=1 Tax=Pantoea sp. paga TaxID=2597519 RepID=UPI00117C71DB|nr:McbB family protein [Pantoea sp. paga]TSH78705.1 McbB family protein [Pantoea sp. paga]